MCRLELNFKNHEFFILKMSEIDSKYKIKVTKGEEEADIY